MKITLFIKLSTILIVLILSALVVVIYQAKSILDNVIRSEEHRSRALQLTNELFQSSDDLTHMARTYVVTGKSIYESRFFEILDIRNGSRPRPQNYSSTYWHLGGAGFVPTSVSNEIISLQELMRREGLNEHEFNLLQLSQSYSDTLVNLEKQAFAAMKGLFDDGQGNFTVRRAPDRDFAINLLYGERYFAEKARIMLPLEQLKQELDVRTQNEVSSEQDRLGQQIFLALALIGTAFAGVTISVLYLRRNVLQPLDYLERQTVAVAQGNYATHCDIQTNNELAGLGDAFNRMAEAIKCDIEMHEQAEIDLLHAKEIAEHTSSDLTAYIEAIGKLALTSVTDHSGRILQVNAKFCEVSGYSEQELIGQNHRILNSGTHPKAFFVNMWATIACGKVWHAEICNRSKSGQLYWVDSTIVPLKDSSRKIARYLSVRVDITARQHKELALQERLKESVCLHAIRHDMELALPVDEFCQKVVEHLKAAMQFPEMAVVVIEHDDKRFTSGEYSQDLTHGLQAQVMANNKICGKLQVFYHEDTPFLLPEEQNLLDVIATNLGRWLEQMQAEQRIVQMATHDGLTGLPNRTLLQDRIAQALAHNRRSQEQAAVLFIDLDHFKIINDSLGHDVGDALLQQVAARLMATTRGEDTVARQGGDEFIVLLPSLANAQDVEAVAQKILDALIQPFQIDDQELHIGGSIGIALFPPDGEDGDTLLKNSDIAMYHAKESGRNNYQFFSAEMNQQAAEKHALGIDLRHTLERNELLLYFQPVIDIPGGKLTSMEVLLRWQHPRHGLILPSKFIPLAEETGMIVPIGEWVLRQACLQIMAWRKQGYAVPKLAVNISARQFRQKTLVADITRILAETGVEARCLVLEITESMLVANVEETIKTLHQLSALGLEISIDDFGTGYSSLSYLKRYPINTLKIDQSFVRDITTDPNDAAIIGAIIAMAHSLKMKVLAEGVETEEQLAFLTRQGCGRFQGFYFDKPLPAAEIENRLQLH